jgi:hypothetical protein
MLPYSWLNWRHYILNALFKMARMYGLRKSDTIILVRLFCLWVMSKYNVYINKPHTEDDPKWSIQNDMLWYDDTIFLLSTMLRCDGMDMVNERIQMYIEYLRRELLHGFAEKRQRFFCNRTDDQKRCHNSMCNVVRIYGLRKKWAQWLQLHS